MARGCPMGVHHVKGASDEPGRRCARPASETTAKGDVSGAFRSSGARGRISAEQELGSVEESLGASGKPIGR